MGALLIIMVAVVVRRRCRSRHKSRDYKITYTVENGGLSNIIDMAAHVEHLRKGGVANATVRKITLHV